MEFGEKLRKARQENGMTQQTLADKLFVTRQAVSRWENGARYPDIVTLKKISEILNISVDELVGDENPMKIVERTSLMQEGKETVWQTAIYVLTAVPYAMQAAGLLPE